MRALLILGAVGAALTVSACAGDYYGPRHGGGYAAYYDDAYGPIHDGHWGDDGRYYYRNRGDGEYIRDDAGHFRRDAYTGFHGYGEVGVGVGVR